MARMVQLLGRVRGQEEAAGARWVNPDQIVYLQPQITDFGTSRGLSIEVKLRGVDTEKMASGPYETIDDADTAWQGFLAKVNGDGDPLIGLLGRIRGREEPGPVMWVNPDHVVFVQPRYTEDDTHVELNADIKLEGAPVFKTWFGRFGTRADAETQWQVFLAELHGT